MRTTSVASDARRVPSIAEQLRTARRRRARARRAGVAALLAAPAMLVIAHLVDGAGVERAGAGSTGWSATTATLAAPQATALDPGLVDAFVRAQALADEAGHELTITSGYRTADEQAALLEAEVEERGSLAEAMRWVFPPDRSMHVRGLAIDVGDGSAADWLADGGARFGLCKTLDWEWWHFEWRARWEQAGACPAPARTPEDAPGP
jgi:hypothetical protein